MGQIDNMSAELSDRMRELAEQIGQLPSTGMIEAERALEILGKSVGVLLEAIDLSGDHIALADRLIMSCNRLHAENAQLRRNNNELAFLASFGIATEGSTMEGTV